jgi:hypothetical protein
VRAIKQPRNYFGADVEQIPNPGFVCDYDGNGRPDGYQRCRYAPAELQAPHGGRAAEMDSGATTSIYGPEPGRMRFSFALRSADDRPCKVTPVATMTEIDASGQYHFGKPQRLPSVEAAGRWSQYETLVQVGPDVDRLKIEWEISPPGKILAAAVSWRAAPAVKPTR